MSASDTQRDGGRPSAADTQRDRGQASGAARGRGLSDAGATAALTRWRVEALAGAGGAHDLGDPRWRLELLRCRGGRPSAWEVVWRPAAERLELDMAEREESSAPPALATRGRRRGAA